GVDNGARVRQRLVAGDCAVARAVGAGSGAARRGERRKADARQDARRSGVPGVGDDECARPLMKGTKGIALVELSDGHGDLLRCGGFCGKKRRGVVWGGGEGGWGEGWGVGIKCLTKGRPIKRDYLMRLT